MRCSRVLLIYLVEICCQAPEVHLTPMFVIPLAHFTCHDLYSPSLAIVVDQVYTTAHRENTELLAQNE